MSATGLRWEPPTGRPALVPGETHVYAFDADETGQDLDAFEAVLSIDERSRAQRLVEPVDRRRFIAGRGLLRRTLADYTGVAVGDIRFEHPESGKPALAGGATLRFNASGSGSLVLIALCQGCEIGVDVERIRPIDDRIAKDAMTADEFARHRDLPDAERERHFFATWVAKEAVSKALGSGLRLGFSDFSCPRPGGRIEWSVSRADCIRPTAWVCSLPAPRAGHAAAVAFTAEPAAIRLWTDFNGCTPI